jgi:uncharacterized protein with HEPN domain
MRRDEVLRILHEHRAELQHRFGVSSLRIFGSVARDDASSGSDVDILVDFDVTPSLFGFLRLRGFLEELLGSKVDLITEGGLKGRARDIRESCSRIVEDSKDLSRDEVFSDRMRFDGILHNFHVIGEAVKRLPDDLRAAHPDIPWKDITGMRDVISHAYFALDLDILWAGITEDIPVLLERVEEMIEEHSANA